MFDTFGNKVRIKRTPETEGKGLADKEGVVYGHSTPSMMDIEVIGKTKNDFAINLYFEDLEDSYWFDEGLIETVDNGNGSVITLDGVDKKWTKDSNGNWIEENTIPNIVKKWWQFWK
jgi:hypothetical protein